MDGPANPPEPGAEANGVPLRTDVEAQLKRILSARTFARSERLKQLLTYLVQRKLDKPENRATEKKVAYELLGKDEFDYSHDTNIRVTMVRLRGKLDQYYASEGENDPVIIELWGYEPQFAFRTVSPASSDVPLTETPLPEALLPEALLPEALLPEASSLEASSPEAPSPDPPLAIRQPRPSWKYVVGVLAAFFLCVVVSQYLIHGRDLLRPAPIPASTAAIPPRLLAHATSEGQTVRVIGSERHYGLMLITPDGRKLYAVESPGDQWVIVFGIADLEEKYSFKLPKRVLSGFMSRDGTHIYFGSSRDGVFVVNTASNSTERKILTGGAVLGLAASSDNRKLFVAMGPAGAKRIDLQTGDVRLLSSFAYPVDVGLDHSGRNLYVSYQHGGPGGRRGHDSVEIYGVATERVSYVINDLPMVGAKPLFAPRDEVVLFDMRDACLSRDYDHVGCPPGSVGGFHLWRPADRRLIVTLPFPKPSEIGGFLSEGTRLFFAGEELAVWDWARQQVLEKMKPPDAADGGEIASSGNRIFVRRKSGGIFVFDAEKPECQPSADGLATFYSADGTVDDARGTGRLTGQGKIRFAPGRIGKAFDFDGHSGSLVTKIAADYCPFCKLFWTEAFFVKFRSITGTMTMMESPAAPYNPGRQIFKTNDNHIVLETGGGRYPRVTLRSEILVQANRWYHVAVVTQGNRKTLFVDGVRQDERIVPISQSQGDHGPAIFGGDSSGRHALNGLLDEIVVYSRALAPDEVKSLAESCVAP